MSEDEVTDSEDLLLFKIEEVSSVKTPGKQFNAKMIFSDTEELYHTELECQLDTGTTCNVMGLRDLAVINQTGDPPLRSSKVKLKLLDSSLDFQIVENSNKPLLYAETCEELGLFKLTLILTLSSTS